MNTVTCTFNPLTHKVVPRELDDEIAEAIAKSANCCGGIADDIWRSAIAAAPEYPADAGWISVDDRLPDSKEMIIFAREKNDGEWALDLNYWTVSNRWAKEYTHWMPLPPAPEAK